MKNTSDIIYYHFESEILLKVSFNSQIHNTHTGKIYVNYDITDHIYAGVINAFT